MIKIFIIGITGFIGQHLSNELRNSKNLLIKGLTRKSYSELDEPYKNIDYIQGDLLNLEKVANHIEQDSIIINLAYLSGQTSDVNLQVINNLLDICIEKKIKKMIHCSTAVVAGKLRNKVITEETICNPKNNYERTKYKIEHIIIEKTRYHFPITILRPTAVFGENGKNLLKLANEIKEGNQVTNYLKSCLFQSRKMNLVAVENVVAAIIFLINLEQINSSETLIISDDDNEDNNYQYIKAFLSTQLNPNYSSFPVIKFPICVLTILQRLFKKPSINPLQIFSNQKLYQAGFRRKVTLDEALRNFSDWYKTEETKTSL